MKKNIFVLTKKGNVMSTIVPMIMMIIVILALILFLPKSLHKTVNKGLDLKDSFLEKYTNKNKEVLSGKYKFLEDNYYDFVFVIDNSRNGFGNTTKQQSFDDLDPGFDSGCGSHSSNYPDYLSSNGCWFFAVKEKAGDACANFLYQPELYNNKFDVSCPISGVSEIKKEDVRNLCFGKGALNCDKSASDVIYNYLKCGNNFKPEGDMLCGSIKLPTYQWFKCDEKIVGNYIKLEQYDSDSVEYLCNSESKNGVLSYKWVKCSESIKNQIFPFPDDKGEFNISYKCICEGSCSWEKEESVV